MSTKLAPDQYDDSIVSTTIAIAFTLDRNITTENKPLIYTTSFSELLYNKVSEAIINSPGDQIIEAYEGENTIEEFEKEYKVDRKEMNKIYPQQKHGSVRSGKEASHILSFELFNTWLATYKISVSYSAQKDIAVLLNRGKNLYLKSKHANRTIDRNLDREIAISVIETYQYKNELSMSTPAIKRIQRIILSCQKFIMFDTNVKTNQPLSTDGKLIISRFITSLETVINLAKFGHQSTECTIREDANINELTQSFAKLAIEKNMTIEKETKKRIQEYEEAERVQLRREHDKRIEQQRYQQEEQQRQSSYYDYDYDYEYNSSSRSNNNYSSSTPSGFHYTQSSNPTGPTKSNGTPDMRFKANRE